MTDLSRIPVRSAPTEYDDDCCDFCCAVPVAEVIDGDRMCQGCADQWVRAQQPDEDEIAELERSMRGAGIYRGAMIEARLEDARLTTVAKAHRNYNREFGK